MINIKLAHERVGIVPASDIPIGQAFIGHVSGDSTDRLYLKVYGRAVLLEDPNLTYDIAKFDILRYVDIEVTVI